MSEFDAFIARFGLGTFPFSQYSTEQEQERQQLFYSPKDYSRIATAFEAGQSMFIVGNRGTGKTAVLFDLLPRARSRNRLSTVLHDFSSLSNPPKAEEYYRKLIELVVGEIYLGLIGERSRIDKLTEAEKSLLVYLFRTYLPAVSKDELFRRIQQIRYSPLSRVGVKLYNFSRDLLNYGLSTAIQLSSDLEPIRKLSNHGRKLPGNREPSRNDSGGRSPSISQRSSSTSLSLMSFGSRSSPCCQLSPQNPRVGGPAWTTDGP